MAMAYFLRSWVCSFLILFPLLVPLYAAAEISDRVLAVVDDEVITLSDYSRFLITLGDRRGYKDVDEALLKKLIEERVVLREAKRKGSDVSASDVDALVKEFSRENGYTQDQLEAEVAQNGLDIGSFRRFVAERAVIARLVLSEVDAKVVVTPKEIEAYYAAHRRDFLKQPARVEIKAIFLRSAKDASVTEITDLKRKALKVAGRLRTGVSFEELAEQYSDHPLKVQEGDLGEFAAGALMPELDRKVFSMKVGEISDPVWAPDGVYIIKLVNRSDEIYEPLKEVGEEVKARAYREKRETAFHEWLKRLWEKVTVKMP